MNEEDIELQRHMIQRAQDNAARTKYAQKCRERDNIPSQKITAQGNNIYRHNQESQRNTNYTSFMQKSVSQNISQQNNQISVNFICEQIQPQIQQDPQISKVTFEVKNHIEDNQIISPQWNNTNCTIPQYHQEQSTYYNVECQDTTDKIRYNSDKHQFQEQLLPNKQVINFQDKEQEYLQDLTKKRKERMKQFNTYYQFLQSSGRVQQDKIYSIEIRDKMYLIEKEKKLIQSTESYMYLVADGQPIPDIAKFSQQNDYDNRYQLSRLEEIFLESLFDLTEGIYRAFTDDEYDFKVS